MACNQAINIFTTFSTFTSFAVLAAIGGRKVDGSRGIRKALPAAPGRRKEVGAGVAHVSAK